MAHRPRKASPGRVILTYGRSLMALVIARSLAQRGVEVYGCDDVDLTVLSFSKHVKEAFTVAPWKTDPNGFLDDLEAAVREYAPRDGRPYVLMPVFKEGELISQNRDRFEPTIKVAMPTWESMGLTQPKDHLAATIEKANLPAPKTWIIPDKAALHKLAPTLEYPLIVKPSEGAGGRGVSLAENPKEAIEQAENLGFSPLPLFQTLAPGSDYCVAVLADKGELAAIMAYRNITTFPREAGAGAVRETVDAEPFREATAALMKATNWDGLAEVDFRWTGDVKDIPLLIEVNARFWAGIFHSIQTAVDFPWLLFQQTVGLPLDHVDHPDIGARTKTPGVWLLAALEEVAASSPRLAAAGEAWRKIRQQLSEGQLNKLKDQFGPALGAFSLGELATELRAELAEAKGAPSEVSEDDDPLVGLGALFVLSSLVKHGKLPEEVTYEASDKDDDDAPPPVPRPPHGRPAIGVTMPDEGDTLMWQAMKFAIWTAGGEAVRLTSMAPRDPMTIDGLVFGGGSDVHPEAYEGQAKPGYNYDMARHDMEASWGMAARDHDLPVLGVCRGAQLLNVLAGGTLHEDLSEFDAKLKPSRWDQLTVRKPVKITKRSRLAEVLGRDTVDVNLIHEQAIDRLGVGLQVAARQDNGVIQAVEDRTRRFWIGVQYHPELLIHRTAHRKLFEGLVKAAIERRAERAAPVD